MLGNSLSPAYLLTPQQLFELRKAPHVKFAACQLVQQRNQGTFRIGNFLLNFGKGCFVLLADGLPDDYLYISKEKYDEYSSISGKVAIGDMLVTGVGTIGIPYLVENSEPLYFKDGNIIWFKNQDAADGKFLFYSFLSETVQAFITE